MRLDEAHCLGAEKADRTAPAEEAQRGAQAGMFQLTSTPAAVHSSPDWGGKLGRRRKVGKDS